MRTVKIYVSRYEMEKAVEGNEFLGYPTTSSSNSTDFEMHVDFNDIIGVKYSNMGNGKMPEAIVCRINKAPVYYQSPPPSSPPPKTGMGW